MNTQAPTIKLSTRPLLNSKGEPKTSGFWIDADAGDGNGSVGVIQVFLTKKGSRKGDPDLIEAVQPALKALGLSMPFKVSGLSARQREALLMACAERIEEMFQKDEGARRDAAIEGRVGLKDMSDDDLMDYAADTWGLTLANLGV